MVLPLQHGHPLVLMKARELSRTSAMASTVATARRAHKRYYAFSINAAWRLTARLRVLRTRSMW